MKLMICVYNISSHYSEIRLLDVPLFFRLIDINYAAVLQFRVAYRNFCKKLLKTKGKHLF